MIQRRDVVKTTLEPDQWYDTDTVMLYAMMSLLKQFVEKEVGVDKIVVSLERELDGVYLQEHPEQREGLEKQVAIEKEIKAIYDWWEGYEDKLKRVKEAEDLLEAEEKLCAEEDEILHRLINVRRKLWTSTTPSLKASTKAICFC